MYNYWRELWDVREEGDPFEITCPLSLSDWQGRPAGRVRRAIDRYWRYPAQVGRLAPQGIVHILDHSSAHLIDKVPSGSRVVVTVHDIIPLVDAGGLSSSQVERFRRVVLRLRKADHLVSVSEYTKKEAVRLLDCDPERITVVPNGVCHAGKAAVDWAGRRAIDQWREKNPAGIVLGSVGSTLARKNLKVFVEAAQILRERGLTVALARVGALLSDDLRAGLVEHLGEDSVMEFARASSEELNSFYQMLDLMVVPSTYEGFGLPVLEAMQHGIPVISSNASSLPEVGGEVARYFDPLDPSALAEEVARLARPEDRELLREPSRAQAARFSWRQHLESFYEIYSRLGVAA